MMESKGKWKPAQPQEDECINITQRISSSSDQIPATGMGCAGAGFSSSRKVGLPSYPDPWGREGEGEAPLPIASAAAAAPAEPGPPRSNWRGRGGSDAFPTPETAGKAEVAGGGVGKERGCNVPLSSQGKGSLLPALGT